MEGTFDVNSKEVDLRGFMEDENLKYLLRRDIQVQAAADEAGRGLVDWKDYQDHQLLKLSRIFREEGFDDAAEKVESIFIGRNRVD